MLCALIMAGGKGTRFWPLSTEEKPKQFLNLLGKKTMIQMTIDRVRPIIPIERVFVCTVSSYVELVKEQLPELPEENIIIEPEGRNTAPCIALSSMIINRKFKDASIAVLPSDHLIKDEEKFRNIILDCNEFLDNNETALITIGMKPDRPETGYGYIRYNQESFKLKEDSFIKVDKFVEKPNLEKAELYLNEGNYLWNGGMFIWKASNIINQIREYCPEIYEPLKDIARVDEANLDSLIKERYSDTKEISIDYAVLEKSNEIYVLPADIGWDDIGTWKSVERYKKKDDFNNIIEGNARAIESTSNIALNSGKRIVLIGIKDVMALQTEDSIYIVNKDKMENLREYKNII